MRIIQVNKFHYLRGGAEKYYLTVSKALEKNGHQVANFSMKHPRNQESSWSKYFISRLSFSRLRLRDIIKIPRRMIYSREARVNFKKLVEDFKPDIVHLHNIYHHISPSILPVAKKAGAKIVMTLHDYKLVCPNYQMYSRGRTIWDACGSRFYRCAIKKYFKNSYIQSFLVSFEYLIHHYFLNIYDKNIDLYIAPSHFMKKVCVRFGISEEKIEVLHNFIEDDEIVKEAKPGDYWLYFGRLSNEKGINDLITAYGKTEQNTKLKIVGEGPEKDNLKKMVKEANLEDKIEFTGVLYDNDLKQVIAGSQAVIMPSVWPENMPFSLIEALGNGKPVIAAKTGGLPELIEPKKNGLLFKAGDTDDLANKLREFEKLDKQQLSNNALESARELGLKDHMKKLESLYRGHIL